MELLDSQIDKAEAQMTEIMKLDDSVIMIIQGIGYINGGMIPSEIGDIHRFIIMPSGTVRANVSASSGQ